MAVELRKILEIEADGSSDANPGEGIDRLNNKQFAVESMNDPNLGFKMWGGKDNAGKVTKWLAKDEDARVKNMAVTEKIDSNEVFPSSGDLNLFSFNAINLAHGTGTNISGPNPFNVNCPMTAVGPVDIGVSPTVLTLNGNSINSSEGLTLSTDNGQNLILSAGGDPMNPDIGDIELNPAGQVTVGAGGMDVNGPLSVLGPCTFTSVRVQGSGPILDLEGDTIEASEALTLSTDNGQDMTLNSNNNIILEPVGAVVINSLATFDVNAPMAVSGILTTNLSILVGAGSPTSLGLNPDSIGFSSASLASPGEGTLWYDGTNLLFQKSSGSPVIVA